MVCDDRLIEWDAPRRRSNTDVMRRRLCANGWLVDAAAGNPHVTSVSPRKEELADGLGVLTPKPVLMDRSPDPPAGGATAARRTVTSSRSWPPLVRPSTGTTERGAGLRRTVEDLPNLPSQGLGAERFGQDRVSRLEPRTAQLFGLGTDDREARHVEHLRIRALAGQASRQFDAVETWHHDVGQ